MMITCPLCHCPWYGEDNLSPDTVITCSCGNDLMMPDKELSRLCQCAHPDIVVEGEAVWCAGCGGDIPNPEMALYDPLQDVADARQEARYGVGL